MTFLLAAAAALTVVATGCGQIEAHQAISHGQDALQAQAYDQAVTFFQQALQAEPNQIDARRGLAAAYQGEITPGAPAAQNQQLAHQAETAYKQVLAQNPNDVDGTTGLGSVYLNLGQPSAARTYYTKAQKLTPNDPAVYAALGAIDWQEVNQQVLAARNTLGSTDPDNPIVDKASPMQDKKICVAATEKYKDEVADGIRQVQKSLALRPDSAETMSSLNLLYRQQADLTCGMDESIRTAALVNANTWNDKAVALRKMEVAKQNVQIGVVDDTQKN